MNSDAAPAQISSSGNSDWRALVPADLPEAVFWQAAGPLIDDDEPPAADCFHGCDRLFCAG